MKCDKPFVRDMMLGLYVEIPRPLPRNIIGISNAYGSEGLCLRVLTLNVTVLTIARLNAVLDKAAAEQAGVVSLQDTKRPRHGFRWALKTLAE